jgi:hypothetical protein
MLIRFLRKEYDTDYYRDMEQLQAVLKNIETQSMELNKKKLAALFKEKTAFDTLPDDYEAPH